MFIETTALKHAHSGIGTTDHRQERNRGKCCKKIFPQTLGTIFWCWNDCKIVYYWRHASYPECYPSGKTIAGSRLPPCSSMKRILTPRRLSRLHTTYADLIVTAFERQLARQTQSDGQLVRRSFLGCSIRSSPITVVLISIIISDWQSTLLNLPLVTLSLWANDSLISRQDIL